MYDVLCTNFIFAFTKYVSQRALKSESEECSFNYCYFFLFQIVYLLSIKKILPMNSHYLKSFLSIKSITSIVTFNALKKEQRRLESYHMEGLLFISDWRTSKWPVCLKRGLIISHRFVSYTKFVAEYYGCVFKLFFA